MVRTLGALVGAAEKAEDLAGSLQARLDQVVRRSAGRPRPRVYFEEWDDPLIAGIGWVSELIEIAGGEDVFASRRSRRSEEHTSELQSLMRISYAVFCLKKKNNTRHIIQRSRDKNTIQQILKMKSHNT